MEMIFLQQATGVATHQLPTSVMRSLSRADNLNPLSMQLAGEITKEHAALYYGEDANADQEMIGPSATGASADEAPANDEPMQPEDVLKAVNLAQRSEDVASYMRTNKPTTADEARTLSVSFELQEAIRLSHELFVDSSPSKTSVDAAQRSMSKEGGDHRFRGIAKDSEAIRSLQDSTRGTLPWVEALCKACDPIVNALIPTAASLDQRMKIFKFVRDLVCRTSGTQLFPAGSFVTHTFLPDGDIDGTVFVPKMLDDSWYVKINEALCLSAFNPTPGEDFTVSNVSFLNNEIKTIRSLINGVSFDVTTNQAVSLQVEALMERVDEFIGNNHLFKRSLLLVKAWMAWEFEKYIDSNLSSELQRQQKGREMTKILSTQSLILMLIFTFNKEGEHISHPFQALVHLLDLFLKFDWASMAMTIRGPISRDDLDPAHNSNNCNNAANVLGLMVSSGFLPEEVVDMAIKDEIKSEKPAKGAPSSIGAAVSEAAVSGTTEQVLSAAPSAISPMNADGQITSVAPSGTNSPKGYNRRVFTFGILNLVDPFQADRNVLESIDASDCDLIVSVFLEAYKHLQVICKTMVKTEQPLESEATKVMKLLFPNTIARYGTIPMGKLAVSDGNGDVLLAAKQDMNVRLMICTPYLALLNSIRLL